MDDIDDSAYPDEEGASWSQLGFMLCLILAASLVLLIAAPHHIIR